MLKAIRPHFSHAQSNHTALTLLLIKATTEAEILDPLASIPGVVGRVKSPAQIKKDLLGLPTRGSLGGQFEWP